MPPPCSPGRLPDPRLDRRPGEAEGSWKVANLKLEPTMRRGRANHFARWAGWPVPCVRPAGYQEASPSPVYGAALLMRFGLLVHPGFTSPSLRSTCASSDEQDSRRRRFDLVVSFLVSFGPPER